MRLLCNSSGEQRCVCKHRSRSHRCMVFYVLAPSLILKAAQRHASTALLAQIPARKECGTEGDFPRFIARLLSSHQPLRECSQPADQLHHQHQSPRLSQLLPPRGRRSPRWPSSFSLGVLHSLHSFPARMPPLTNVGKKSFALSATHSRTTIVPHRCL